MALALATVGYCAYLSTIPGLLSEIKEVSQRTHDDLKEWGLNKIEFNFTRINDRSLTHKVIDDDNEGQQAGHRDTDSREDTPEDPFPPTGTAADANKHSFSPNGSETDRET